MLYHFFTPLVGSCRLCIIFNVFNYITFRSAGAAVTGLLMAFVVGPFVIRRLRAMKVRQVIRAGTPDSHQEKSSTPTMGGVIFLIAGLMPDAALGAAQQPLRVDRGARDRVDGMHWLHR